MHLLSLGLALVWRYSEVIDSLFLWWCDSEV
jgi:hypothetical protein